MTDQPLPTNDEQPYVQVLRSEAGTYHLAVDNQRACELRGQPVDATATAAELKVLPADTPAAELCSVCFELGRGG